MIINQALNVNTSGNRPAPAGKTAPGNTGSSVRENSAASGGADTVAVSAQRLIVSENLNASQALIADREQAGHLVDMLKRQLEFNPAQAMEAQTSKLSPGVTRLLAE